MYATYPNRQTYIPPILLGKITPGGKGRGLGRADENENSKYVQRSAFGKLWIMKEIPL